MLRSRLTKIARSLDEELDLPMRLVAEAIEAGAKGRAPVNTGALRDAIHVEKRGEGSYAVVAGDGDVFYGHLVEGGTTKAPAHPFLVPAAEAERDNVDEIVRRALGDL